MEIYSSEEDLEDGKTSGMIDYAPEVGYARIYASTDTTKKNYKDTLLHEFVHLLLMWIGDTEGNHSKRFYSILNYLKKEFKC